MGLANVFHAELQTDSVFETHGADRFCDCPPYQKKIMPRNLKTRYHWRIRPMVFITRKKIMATVPIVTARP